MSVSSLQSPNPYALRAASLSVSGTMTTGDLVVSSSVTLDGVSEDNTATQVLCSAGGEVSTKANEEITTNPTWVWLNGSNPQPALVTIKAIRSGDYAMCQLLVNGIQLAAVGGPYFATFTLPWPVATPFVGSASELMATSAFDPTDSAVVTRCRLQSRSGSSTLGQVYLDNTTDQTVTLGATFMYSGLA